MIREMDISWRTENWDTISRWYAKAFGDCKPTKKDIDLIDLIRVLSEDEKRVDLEEPCDD